MENIILMTAAFQLALCHPVSKMNQGSKTIDLTHSFDSNTIYWPTSKNFTHEKVWRGMTNGGFYYEANNYAAAEHGGTHMDAPAHFCDPNGIEKCWRSDEVPVSRMHGEGVVLDVSPLVFDPPESPLRDFQLTASQLAELMAAWEISHDRSIGPGAIILLHTGWARFWKDEGRYLGNKEKDASNLHFPGIHPEAATWLLKNHPDISMVGIDTASIDFGGSSDFKTHQILLGANIPCLENVANLEQLLDEELEGKFESSVQILALPMKIKDGSGGPTRVLAILSSAASSSASSHLLRWR